MNNLGDKMNDSTSGYTQDIDGELTESSPIPVQNGFDNIREVYVSCSQQRDMASGICLNV